MSGIALPALSVLIYGRLATGSKKPLNGKGGDGGPMKPPAYAVVSVLHRPVEFASKSGCSQLAALGRGRVETVFDLRACRTRGLVVVIGATESSSSLVAQTRGWFRSRVAARAAKSVKEAHAPASRIAFIVLGAPMIASVLQEANSSSRAWTCPPSIGLRRGPSKAARAL